MKNSVILLLLVLMCFTDSIAQRIIRPLPNNPTSYSFKTSIDKAGSLLEKGIRKKSTLHFEVSDIYYYGNRRSVSWPKEATQILSKDGNQFDVFLSVGVDSSDVYFRRKKKPYPYQMKCLVHFTPKGMDMVDMQVQVLEAKIETGKKLLPSLPHFVNDAVYKNVKPTTIEEYKLILCMAWALGVSDKMPTLKM